MFASAPAKHCRIPILILASGFVILVITIFITILNIQLAKPALAQQSSEFVTAEGTKLYLHGQEFQFTGVNAFNLATLPGYNAGCGGYIGDLDYYFSKLRPNSVVRMWAFQGSAATNVSTKKLDWSGLDRAVNAAQRNGVKLIMVLGNQDGNCDDGHYKDKSWYEGGYKLPFNDLGNNLTPLPYLDYVKEVVGRYKNSAVIAMWEPINEPAAGECVNGTGYDCYKSLECRDERGSAAALKTFFDSIGATIKSIDPNHLISSGALGNGQCGTVFEDYQYVHSSSGIDVGSYHDYDRPNDPIPGDQWNGLGKRIEQMKNLNKPIYIGETGMVAGEGSNCLTLSQRRDKLKAKMDAQFSAGVAGFVPWSLTMGNSSGCNFDIVSFDPLLVELRDYPVSMSTNTTVSATPFPTPVPLLNDTKAPTSPADLKSTVSTNQISLSWSPSSDNVKVVRYDIYRDYQYITSTTGTSLTNTSLKSGTKYMYYIKARDAAGNSSVASAKLYVSTSFSGPTPTPTPQPTPTLPDTQPPAAPVLNAANVETDKVTLSWNKPADNVGAVRYDIYRDYSYVTSTMETKLTNTKLKAGTKYMYYIKAKDAAGNSSIASNKVTITTNYAGPTPTPVPTSTPTPVDTIVPTSPTNLHSTAVAENQISISWDAATDNVGVVRYDIFRNYSYVTSTYGTSLTNTKLTAGTKYMYYVKARDAAGHSSTASNKLTVTTQ